MKEMRLLTRKASKFDGKISDLPMKSDIIIVTTAIENIMPIWRIALTVAPAMPYALRSTELMIALVLGDENRAKPKPRKTRQATT